MTEVHQMVSLNRVAARRTQVDDERNVDPPCGFADRLTSSLAFKGISHGKRSWKAIRRFAARFHSPQRGQHRWFGNAGHLDLGQG
ncbi:MAG TPA: hypothetical protein VF534_03830 [Paraburkholderia sp.]